ncbi:hypothetical protein GGI02_004178, partial [Coemansia sp. RSA 2322]
PTSSSSATNVTSRARTSSLLRTANNASSAAATDSASIKSAPQQQLQHPKARAHARGASTSSAENPSLNATPAIDGGASDEAASGVGMQLAMMSGGESDDDDDEYGLYIARDLFFSSLAEMRSQLFIQDRLLEGLGKSRTTLTPNQQLSEEELGRYLDIAAQTTGQSRVLLDSLDRAFRNSTIGWQTRLRHEQERIDMLADSLRTAVVSSQATATVAPPKQATEDVSQGAPPITSASSGLSMSATAAAAAAAGDEGDESSESEFADATDEFFDTVTSLASLTKTSTAEPAEAEPPIEEIKEQDEEAAPAPPAEEEPAQLPDMFELSGYALPVSVRSSLPAITTGGPSLNLWSVIKGAIGKDLSKISVPVFFNEPTSFLQRFTEDMEYCDLLEIATMVPRSEDRTLFVAGFAMSNYASTFGRIAKPFNPLLGETFEYVRRDKRYRALSEQVEHHPPISACWIEGKNYVYHADTNIKSKFNGGSLTVVPTGVCHVELRLPLAFLDREEERSAGDPRQPPIINKEGGYFTEHYTWNKLTTNVNGIMIANFWIEHVGDLDVVNHRTGDRTKVTFVPSGWMGKNKFKVTGQALNRRGALVHEIAGDWTSKLVARPPNTASTAEDCSLNPSQGGGGPMADGVVDVPRRPFVLWKVNERQTTSNTYHLTTYAMSLNDRPPELEPFLCPTDSRFRPDQRAMETGAYELADREKSRLENKQRATRRRREQGELPTWKPRWFVRDTDPDSGESYWRFTGDYWTERELAATKTKHGSNVDVSAWSNVEDIF